MNIAIGQADPKQGVPPDQEPMFHDVNPSYFGRPAGVLDGAVALRATLTALKRVAGVLVSDPAQQPLEARRLLADLSGHLTVYFDARESTRYFAAVIAERPDLEDGVDALLNGRNLLRDSVTYVRRMAFRNHDLGDVGRGITGVLERFEQHELSEHDLVERFFRQDGANLLPAAP